MSIIAKKESPEPEKKLLHCPKCNAEFPAQGRERYVHIVDVVRENQREAGLILLNMKYGRLATPKLALSRMHKQDRDAILQPGGILTSEQIELLK